MLKPKKKITRRDIEQQDDIITRFNKARSFYDVNRKYITYGLTALVVVLVAGYIFMMNREKNNEKASVELGKVFSIYDNAANNPQQYQMAIDGQPERNIIGLKSIVDQFGGTENGQLARFYLANAYFHLGKYDEALEQFDDFSSGDKFLKASAAAGIAACHEAKGKFGDAAEAFEKAANIAADELTTPEYLASAARDYMKANENAKARTLFERVKKEFPTSQAARDADRYISQLSV